MKKEEKTNVMRLLEAAGIEYKVHNYESTGAVSGLETVKALGEDPDQCFKTLVTVGKSGDHYVFVVPVSGELNLKKAATAVGEKNIEMIKQKDLLGLTGYIHGGCSPIGMKKQFVTTIDETALLFDRIFFSAGKIGYQIEMNVSDIERIIPVRFLDIV